MAEDSHWLNLSDDENENKEAHFCFMAKEGEESSEEDDEVKSTVSESASEVQHDSLSEFNEHLQALSVRVLETEKQLTHEKLTVQTLESRCKNERELFLKLSLEKAEIDDEVRYLKKCLNKLKEENQELQSNISDLTIKLQSLGVESSENE